MGLTYCKSLCSSSKTQHSVNNGNILNSNTQTLGPQPATAADYNLSTLQNALEDSRLSKGRKFM
jgi:hypothetical protein